MKNIFYSVVALSLMLFASCDNENSVNPETETGNAIIKGNIAIQLDTFPDDETIPDQTQMVFIVNSTDLVLDSATAPYDKYYYGRSNADGTYSIEIPMPANRSASVDIKIEAFRADKITFDGVDSVLVTTNTLYLEKVIPNAATIYKDGTFIVDIDY